MKDRESEATPAPVPTRAIQAGDIQGRWSWVEPSVWTDRMLTALEEGVKGGTWYSLIDKVSSVEPRVIPWPLFRFVPLWGVTVGGSIWAYPALYHPISRIVSTRAGRFKGRLRRPLRGFALEPASSRLRALGKG